MAPLAILPLLYVAKLAATSISLGSGASGGIFSPSLYMGATLGGAFGVLVNMIHPLAEASIANFAIVGMAAMVAGGTGAAMTAVTMIFEMTRDYALVMPMILAVALEHRRAARAVAREYLHHQARRTRPSDPQGAARQHVSGAPRQRDHGHECTGVAGHDRFRLLFCASPSIKAR